MNNRIEVIRKKSANPNQMISPATMISEIRFLLVELDKSSAEIEQKSLYIEQLCAALHEHGDHTPTCKTFLTNDEEHCDCGLNEAFELPEMTKESSLVEVVRRLADIRKHKTESQVISEIGFPWAQLVLDAIDALPETTKNSETNIERLHRKINETLDSIPTPHPISADAFVSDDDSCAVCEETTKRIVAMSIPAGATVSCRECLTQLHPLPDKGTE